jgi:hypothetical protein
MTRVGFCSEDYAGIGTLIPGGCTYYRCLLPANTVGGASTVGKIAFTPTAGFGVRTSGTTATFGFDQVVFKMIMHKQIPRQMRIAQALGQRIIVDIDDHFDGLHDANRAKALTDPERNRGYNRDHLRAIVQQADVVTVTTPFLADYYSGIARDVRLIRNGINPNQFTPIKHTGSKPVIGWAGATSWRSNDLEHLRSWLPDFLERHDLEFLHSGHEPDAPAFHELAGIPIERMLHMRMQPINRYADMLAFDIGIVPLSDIDFNRAKSAIKGLEYAAAGIPFVADPLPEYERIASMGVGRIAHTPEQWTAHMTELLDHSTRKREARRQLQLVLRDHTILNTAHEWVALFNEWEGTVPVRTSSVPYVA